MSRQLPWLRITAEGIAIVVSILLAFGIQALWEERQERTREEALISGLLTEFHRNSQQLDARVFNHGRLASAGRAPVGPRYLFLIAC